MAAVADHVPMRRFALELHGDAREGQWEPCPVPLSPLTVAALAVVRRHRLGGDLIADGAAGASAGIGLAHLVSSSREASLALSVLPAGGGAEASDNLLPAFVMVLWAESFLGRTKPAWTRPRRVPFSTLERAR